MKHSIWENQYKSVNSGIMVFWLVLKASDSLINPSSEKYKQSSLKFQQIFVYFHLADRFKLNSN